MRAVVPFIGGLGLLLLFQGLTGSRRPGAGLVARLDRLAHEAGSSWTGGRIAAVSGTGAVLVFVAVAGATASSTVAAAFAALAAWLPIGVLRGRKIRRRRRFREAWPDAIAALIASVRSGRSLAESCVFLASRGPEGLRAGFRTFTSTYRASGSFEAALERMQTHLGDPIADRVVAALHIAHEVGGTDLVRVLRALGDFVRDDLRVRKEIEARWSWTVTAARVASAAPWIVLLLMSTRPEAARAYGSTAGVVVVLAGAAATVVGYRLMLRAARLPEERRMGG